MRQYDKIKCAKCGNAFDECEMVARDYMIPYGESNVFDTTYVCPHCGSSDTYEVKACAKCGELKPIDSDCNDRIVDDICIECLNKTPLDTVMKVSEYDGKIGVELNTFLAFSFSPKEIEEILIGVLRADPSKAIRDYVDGDPEWFNETLNKVVKENG